jgi:hypothetical protein
MKTILTIATFGSALLFASLARCRALRTNRAIAEGVQGDLRR